MSDNPLEAVDQELDELDHLMGFGSARGGRKVAKPLMIEVVRSLTQEDVPALLEPSPVGSQTPTIVRLRHQHHILAQTLAAGHSNEAASLITGYSISRISILNGDPTFRQLLAHYQGNKEIAFVDLIDRMKALGLSTLEELQSRLDDNPDEWTKRELMDLAELLLVKGKSTGMVPINAPVQNSISISFVSSPNAGESGRSPDGPVIEGVVADGR